MKKGILVKDFKDNKGKYILMGGAFAFFLFMAFNQLMSVPLWLDETWEFYFSKVMVGQIPGVSAENNMYERIINTVQPPLYNIILFVWLQFGESEFWFRLSSVLMGVISAVGLYKCMKKITSYQIASLSVVLYACVYQVIYYTQECGEYIMLLMFLTWSLYFYGKVMEETTVKHILCFTLFCVLSIYTQYGGAFAVVPLMLSVFIKIWAEKDWIQLKKIIGVYATAFIAAGLPLIFLFFLPQMQNSYAPKATSSGLNFYGGNFFSDHLQMFLDVFRWNTIESMTRFYWPALIATLILLLLAIYCMKFSKSNVLKHLLVCNVATWLIYYVLTRMEVYAYGYFGFRYNIFFIPLWLVTILLMLVETYRTLERIPDVVWKKRIQYLYRGIMILTAVGYCVYGSHQILKHWEKSDTKGAVQAWYDIGGYNTTTLVDFNQAKSFTYYFEHHDEYQAKYETNVYREMVQITKNEYNFDEEYQEYKVYMEETFGEEYPQEFYFFVGNAEQSRLIDIVKELGYTVEEVFKTTAQLYYIAK